MITTINGSEYSVVILEDYHNEIEVSWDEVECITFDGTGTFIKNVVFMCDTEADEVIKRITEAQQAAKMLAG